MTDVNNEKNFFTFNGSEYRGEYGLTASQEDYLEMIFRNCPKSGTVRLVMLAKKINVSESSASRMVHKLSETGLVTFEKYGTIYLTRRGRKIGEYLVYRHEVIEKLLCRINSSESELRQTELIEHFLDSRTVKNISEFLKDGKL